MRSRGFTAVELLIVISIAAILLPIVYSIAARYEDEVAVARFQLDVADAVRTVSEELRTDARGDGACDPKYVVRGRALVRTSTCGPDRALARWVHALEPTPGGVNLVFARPLRPHHERRVSVFIPVEAP